ncbi:signal transduction histidine kinase [Microbacterium sp. AK009]|uniref:ATP-binding protein n=1 Tax=Microbacterium sp. AK009 TaxID=2723068 RepID=UPI0015C9960E|nr:ATP-binding protein [Microbacterium sp. AK009]NYF15378.1 signal transduction histidine kinase [Microbacterium sp. AK009]
MFTGGRSRTVDAAPAPLSPGSVGPDTRMPVPAPISSRTRSIWLSQLVLGATVLAVVILLLFLQPAQLASWTFTGGILLLVAITAATMIAPWARLSSAAVLVVPFADLFAIGLLNLDGDLQFAFLWTFPIVWIGLHYGARTLAVALGAVGLFLLIVASITPGTASTIRVVLVMVVLSFIGITLSVGSTRTRAFKRLLRRQARRLRETLDRATAQERRIAEMIDGIDLGIVRLSPDGELLALNAAYRRLYGLGEQEDPAHAAVIEHAAVDGPEVPADARPFARAARGEAFAPETYWIPDAEGTWRAVIVSASPLASRSEEEASMLLVVREVTALLHAERARDQVVAMASHEIRNPLTVILGRAELALERDVDPASRDDFTVIEASAERMLTMLEQTLRDSRSSFTAPRGTDEIDLRAVLEASLVGVKANARARNITLHADFPPALPVRGDAFRLRQVFDNLLTNAVKYTPRQGTVSVRAAVDRDLIHVDIADSGIGIPADDIDRVFEPYFRSSAAGETAPGTGLGLGIARDIVEAHGGTLTLTSQAGEGTTASIRLPRAATP